MSNQVPEGVEEARANYEAKEAILNAYIQEHRAVLEEYERLLVDRNQAVNGFRTQVVIHADQLGRAYGPFKIGRGRRNFDVDLLIDLVGESAEALVKYSVDTKAFDAAVESGALDDEVAQKVVSFGAPVIRGPKAVDIYK